MEEGKAPSRRSLPLLAMGSLGSQCVWSTEMAFASPFLLHLGMSKSNMSIVFIAGPISGLITQPLIGLISDSSTSRWGRRRPFIVASCFLCTLSLLQLGFARPLAGIVTSVESNQTTLTIVLVVLSIFSIDFTINAINALDRALLLDLVESKQQSLANAWSARLSGIGAVAGFLFGQAELTTMAPFAWFPSISGTAKGQLDSTEAQLRCVCLLVIFLLVSTHIVTVIVAKERPSEYRPSTRSLGKGRWLMVVRSAVSSIMELQSTARNLSTPIWEIFRVQFFLWIAWFPVLFYSSSWVGSIARTGSPDVDAVAAMRLGSLSMLLHAVVSILGTIVFPQLLKLYNHRFPRRMAESLTALWSLTILSLSFVLLSTWIVEKTESTRGAMALVALTGLAWALTTWAPYALLGILIQKEAEAQAAGALVSLSPMAAGRLRDDDSGALGEEGAPLMSRLARSSSEQEQGKGEEEDEEDGSERGADYVSRSELMQAGQDCSEEAPPGSQTSLAPNQSATILGLHNISLVLPQFLTTAMSAMIFAFLEPRSDVIASNGATDVTAGSEARLTASSFGLVLRLGGLSAIASSAFAFRLARKYRTALEG